MMIAAAVLCSCSGKGPAVIDLSSSFSITDVDDPSFSSSAQPADDASWQKVKLPSRLSKNKPHQVHWIRARFTIPESLRDKDLSLFLGRIWDVDQTWVNGVKVGQSGTLDPDFFSSWNVERSYFLPAPVLNLQGENVIAIRIYSNPNAIFNGKPYISETSNVETKAFYARMLSQYLPLAGGVLTFICGLLGIITFWFYRNQRISILYSAISFLWSIQSLHYYLPEFGMSYELHHEIYFVITPFVALLIYLFIETLLETRYRLLELGGIILFIAATAVALTGSSDDPMSGWRTSVLGVIGISYMITWVIVILPKLHLVRARILLAGWVLVAASVAHDGLVMAQVFTSGLVLLNLGYPALIISFGAILALNASRVANELAAARDSLRDYATNLEIKVEERTHELKIAKEEVEAAMTKTAALNDSLLSANQGLEEAQRIARLDMNMAAQVQSGLLPRKPPVSDEWDIAFEFVPMAGVSGDLYDFYERNGSLAGLSLFDVSGHGIASGLITLLARPIISRDFMRYPDEKLSVLIDTINRDLIREIQDIDQYLTGIILRFSDDVVEYVNAGHSDLLMRKGTDGKVRIVRPKDRMMRGHFLGIREMQEKFDMITFKAMKNDLLILFSDCIIEAVNDKDEEFGVDRLSESIERAPKDATAQEIIRRIIDDFRSFTGCAALHDDLTVIIARRLK
jgi:sigma-B regulation protein RsbU (phosphoserine phosphatase)